MFSPSSKIKLGFLPIIALLAPTLLHAQCESQVTPLPYQSHMMTISDNGNYLLVTLFDRIVRYNLQSGEALTLEPPEIPAPANVQADTDHDGDQIAFVSLDSPLGYILHLYDIPTKTLTNLIEGDFFTTTPSFSGDGKRLFFYSMADFGENPDRSLEVFRIDLTGGGLIQITDGPFTGGVGIHFEPAGVNFDGTRAAWDSRHLEGGGYHASYWQEGVGLTQLTPDGFYGAELDDSGNLVAFVSNVDLVPGQNPEGYNEVFLYNADNGTYRQLTKASRTPFFISAPDISGGGRFVTVISSGDYNNEYPGSFNAALYIIDTLTGSICTVDESLQDIPAPRITNSGDDIIYSDQDFTILSARVGVGVPTLNHFGLVLLMCAMVAAALPFIRKKAKEP